MTKCIKNKTFTYLFTINVSVFSENCNVMTNDMKTICAFNNII